MKLDLSFLAFLLACQVYGVVRLSLFVVLLSSLSLSLYASSCFETRSKLFVVPFKSNLLTAKTDYNSSLNGLQNWEVTLPSFLVVVLPTAPVEEKS